MLQSWKKLTWKTLRKYLWIKANNFSHLITKTKFHIISIVCRGLSSPFLVSPLHGRPANPLFWNSWDTYWRDLVFVFFFTQTCHWELAQSGILIFSLGIVWWNINWGTRVTRKFINEETVALTSEKIWHIKEKFCDVPFKYHCPLLWITCCYRVRPTPFSIFWPMSIPS